MQHQSTPLRLSRVHTTLITGAATPRPRSFIDSEYVVDTRTIDRDTLAHLQDTLSVNATDKAQRASLVHIPPLVLWSLSNHELRIPRPFGCAFFGAPGDDRSTLGKPISVQFEGTLRPEQQNWADAVLGQFASSFPNGVLQLPCGYGKTATAISIACSYGRQVVFLVDHMSFIQKTVNEIKRFAPTAKVGVVHLDRKETVGVDFTVAIVQTVLARKYTREDFPECGLLIFDECHHVASPSFSHITRVFGARARLGLSATPVSNTRPSETIQWLLGPIVVVVSRRHDQTVVCNFSTYREGTQQELDPKKGRARMLNRIAEDGLRNHAIVRTMTDCILNPAPLPYRRKVLALSDRLHQIETVRVMLLTAMRTALSARLGLPSEDAPIPDDPRYKSADKKKKSDHETEKKTKKRKRDQVAPMRDLPLDTVCVDDSIPNQWRLVVRREGEEELETLFSVGKLVGQQKPCEVEWGIECDVILAVSSIAKENMDVPALDTVFAMMPCANMEQRMGRMLRERSEKNQPLLWYFVDPWGLFQYEAVKARNFCKTSGYIVEEREAYPESTSVPKKKKVSNTLIQPAPNTRVTIEQLEGL